MNKYIKNVKKSWEPMFKEIFDNKEGYELFEYLESRKYTVYPKLNLMFNAFTFFELDELKTVFLGQDPYIGYEIHDGEEIEQAMGLSFSVPKEIKRVPPSLKNIYKEIKNSYPDYEIPNHGDLSDWALNKKMLLLNSALTTKKKKSNHHQKKWIEFTDKIIKYISDNCSKVNFLLLGNFAKNKKKLIDSKKHNIICGVHPSPLSAYRGFFNSDIFKKINYF